MDQQTMIIIVVLILAVAAVILLLRARGGKGWFKLPGVSAGIDNTDPGGKIRRTEFEGDENKARAKGAGAVIEDVTAKGKNNEFDAS